MEQIEIGSFITVSDFSRLMNKKTSEVITKLIENGVMATLNDAIDYDTAEIIASEFDIAVTPTKTQKELRAERAHSDTAELRPPVVAVMGHVDHGKTTLLDTIRKSDTVASEHGGITQHISAYQITHNNKKITFLDTPGHEAFAALREHGAQLTDLALIVVAADDGVKPQTKEAIKFAQRANVPMLVAINKVDKPGADLNRVKQELSDNGILIEEWGGDVVCVEISAKENKNISKLLDMILLVGDVEDLRGDSDGLAEGIVIEAQMIKGRGPVATVLVEHGKLRAGDIVVAGTTFAKVRKLEDFNGREINNATASFPVSISGFKELPNFGNIFSVVDSEKEAKKQVRIFRQNSIINANKISKSISSTTESLENYLAHKDMKELPILVKADVQGSLEALIQSINSIGNDEVSTTIIDSSVGDISESDVLRASSGAAIIFGFNVKVPVEIKKLAIREKVSIRNYTVIYELLDEIKKLLSQMLPSEIIETEIAAIKIKGIFRTTKSNIICGGEVTKGKAVAGSFARILRKKDVIGAVKISKIQREQSQVKDVVEGQMCGLELEINTKIGLEIDDNLVVFTREEKERILE